MAWSRKQAGTQWGPEWPLETLVGFVTRARLRAQGDLQREWTVGDFGVATQCHPGHRKATVTGGISERQCLWQTLTLVEG